LLMTGARPDELCRATISDFDREERMIRLEEHKTRGKTGRARRIPIGKVDILRNAPNSLIRDFYNKYYRPERAVLSAL